jgi:hypothetical protein
MKAELCYAVCIPWHRRRRWRVVLLTVPILVVSYALAVPRMKVLHEQHVRRAQLVDQFESCLQNAEKLICARRPDAAAGELIRAEFPIRIDRRLLRRFEFARFEQRLLSVRQRLFVVCASVDAENEEKLKSERKRRESEAKSADQHCTMILCASNRVGTITSLVQRAAEALHSGRNAAALLICEQIADVEPTFKFDETFWANIPAPR